MAAVWWPMKPIGCNLKGEEAYWLQSEGRESLFQSDGLSTTADVAVLPAVPKALAP